MALLTGTYEKATGAACSYKARFWGFQRCFLELQAFLLLRAKHAHPPVSGIVSIMLHACRQEIYMYCNTNPLAAQ